LPKLREFISRLGRRWTISEMHRAYQLTFRTPNASQYILPDLSEFCHAMEVAPRDSDLFLQGRAAGRRDVYMHIAEWLNLTEDELFAIHYGRSILRQEVKNG
jgi:hypothetical protein